MYYQLVYKINDERISDKEIGNMISRLDYKYVQQLSWTTGHFIVENLENRILTTLIAFPHYEKPNRELQLIQEYILDRLCINYDGIVLHKWISTREDDIDNKCTLLPNNLIIRNYHQDHFFNKILQISINEQSPGIAAEFYANYYFIGNINLDKSIHNTTYKDIEKDINTLTARFEKSYKLKNKQGLPIFIINEQNKLRSEFLRELIINQVKNDYSLELKFSIQTRIDNNILLSELEYINTIQFSNNIHGQVWDITIDTSYTTSGSIHPMLKDNFIPIVLSNRLHTLIILFNPKAIPIDDYIKRESAIII